MTCLIITRLLFALITLEYFLVSSWLPPIFLFHQKSCLSSSKAEIEDEEWFNEINLEVLQGGDNDIGDKDEDWVPDSSRAIEKPKHLTPANEVIPQKATTKTKSKSASSETESERPTPYTEDEEEIIHAMGGQQKARKREEGFLGDSTLYEIATDYSVPICYLADVMCMWGVPVPINVNDRVGDLVTGEQAFALVEAVNSLDIGALQDRYSNQNLLQVCGEWDIDLKDAFAFAMKEGWSLPFGVRTNLRVEQENELLRIYSRFYQE
jgi:hypothetical protein